MMAILNSSYLRSQTLEKQTICTPLRNGPKLVSCCIGHILAHSYFLKPLLFINKHSNPKDFSISTLCFWSVSCIFYLPYQGGKGFRFREKLWTLNFGCSEFSRIRHIWTSNMWLNKVNKVKNNAHWVSGSSAVLCLHCNKQCRVSKWFKTPKV